MSERGFTHEAVRAMCEEYDAQIHRLHANLTRLTAALSRIDEATKECVPGVGLETRLGMMAEDYRRRSDRSELEAALEKAQYSNEVLFGDMRLQGARFLARFEEVAQELEAEAKVNPAWNGCLLSCASLIRQAGNEKAGE